MIIDKSLIRNQTGLLTLSAASGTLMTLLSGLGMIFSLTFYPLTGIREQYLANDPVNILIGLPLFLSSLILIRKGKLLGTLLLPGALVYVIYNYIGYALGRPWDWLAIVYLVVAAMSLITLVLYLRELDHRAVMESLEGHVGRKFSGWVLVVFGLAFIGLAISTIMTGIQAGTIPPLGEAAVSVADIVVSLGWVSGGILLLRKRSLGYSIGLGLLVAASSLFIGLILFFFFAPLVSNRPFEWSEVVAVLGMGLICFVPTGIYWRGVILSQK
jgi:hypothetical protein